MARIAVIGSGTMGKGIARLLAEAGNTVWLGSRDAEQAAETSRILHPAIRGVEYDEAARQADIIFLPFRFEAVHPDIAALREALQGKSGMEVHFHLRIGISRSLPVRRSRLSGHPA